MKNHLKKYWGWYTLLAAAIVGGIIYFNWESISAWWNDEDRSGERGVRATILTPIRDNQGRLTRQFYQVQPDAKKKVPCQKVTYTVNGVTYTGWVGDCNFPIASN